MLVKKGKHVYKHKTYKETRVIAHYQSHAFQYRKELESTYAKVHGSISAWMLCKVKKQSKVLWRYHEGFESYTQFLMAYFLKLKKL